MKNWRAIYPQKKLSTKTRVRHIIRRRKKKAAGISKIAL